MPASKLKSAQPSGRRATVPKRPRVRRGNADDAERMRQDLMRAAVELAEEQGAAAVTIRAVAERLGVSAMTPYRYLDNDPSMLLNGIWTKVLGDLGVALRKDLAEKGTARARFRCVVESLIRFWQDRPDYFALLHGFGRAPAPSAVSQVGRTEQYLAATDLQRTLTEDFARELGAETERVKIACDITLAMALGYLHGTMINRRYPWSDTAILLSAYVDGVVHAVESYLLGDRHPAPPDAGAARPGAGRIASTQRPRTPAAR